MGEIEGVKIEGFHFGNSPAEIQMAKRLTPKMVMRTTSGTQGVVGCTHAEGILVASFVVAEATFQHILDKNPSHVTFIVTGRKNGDEDLALAEYLQKRLEGRDVPLEPYLDRVSASPGGIKYHRSEDPSFHQSDLELALQVNRFSFSMEVIKQGNDLVATARKRTR
jgi:2-phosphosulfolactate phosphatase